jgi:hypothetical protein
MLAEMIILYNLYSLRYKTLGTVAVWLLLFLEPLVYKAFGKTDNHFEALPNLDMTLQFVLHLISPSKN